MFCPKCGNELSEDSQFCGRCGSALPAGESTPRADSSRPVRPKISRRAAITGVACVIAIAAVGAGAWLAFGGGKGVAPDLGQAIPFVASTPRYETCEELTAAACEAFQQMVEGGGEIGSLVEARAKIVGLFPDGALDLMMGAANVESVEALSALIGGFSGLESMSPEQFAVPEGYDLSFVGSAGEDYTEEELENLNDSLKESGFDARVTAAKKVDVKVRVAVENEGSSQGAQQPDAQTIAVVDAIEVDGGWYVSPKEKLAEVVEGARAVSETEFASFSTSRNDGAPTISFDYPTQWEDKIGRAHV